MAFGYNLISYLTAPFKNLSEILDKDFAAKFVDFVQNLILTKLNNLLDSEIRDIDKDAVTGILQEL